MTSGIASKGVTSTCLNIDKCDDSPLFLGETLGLQEYIHPRYPKIYEIFKSQRAQQWVETEIDLSEDQKQWVTLPEGIKEITILNLANQMMMDSMLGRSPLRSLIPFVSNEELEIAYGEIQRTEASLHSVTYTHIIQSVFPDPQAVLDEIKNNKKALKRLELIKGLFDDLYIMSVKMQYEQDILGQEWSEEQVFELKKLILKTLVAHYALESNQFMASFSMTFAVAVQDMLLGFASELVLIAKDEIGIHVDFSETVLQIQKAAWPEVWEEIEEEIIDIFVEVFDNEVSWGEYVLSGDRKVVGLNAVLIKEFLQYVCSGSLKKLDLPIPEHIQRDKNPIPWIEDFIDVGKLQPSPQEAEILNYKIGKVNAEVNVDELDFDI